MKEARGWMAKGIDDHVQFCKAFQSAKVLAARAGWHFLQARRMVGDGLWCLFVGSYAETISQRSVYRYINFAEALISWARTDHPTIEDEAKLLELGVCAALKSPVPFTGILRYSGQMEKLGQYDPDGYTRRKHTKPARADGAKLEFDFDGFIQAVDLIARPDPTILQALNPDRLARLETELEEALERVRQYRATL